MIIAADKIVQIILLFTLGKFLRMKQFFVMYKLLRHNTFLSILFLLSTVSMAHFAAKGSTAKIGM